jgi:inorganic pyrophosphatase
LILASGVMGLLFSLFLLKQVASISLGEETGSNKGKLVAWYTNIPDGAESQKKMVKVYKAISEGAAAFLFAEYKICAIFIVVFGAIVFILTSYSTAPVTTGHGATAVTTLVAQWQWDHGFYTCLSFVVGAVTSIIAGYIGMTVAVYSNARTTIAACRGYGQPDGETQAWTASFNTAFRAGGVMGFCLTALAMLVAFGLATLFSLKFDPSDELGCKVLFECLSGFGLGGSSIAMFGRVGGGIYTKAADVGADLAGKVVEDLPEDDPRNPATIADNVGDNVGDVAGMGSDLFGSFAEGTCAALVVASQSFSLVPDSDGNLVPTMFTWPQLLFPLVISAIGIVVSIVTFFVATDISPVRKESDVETVLKVQLLVSTVLMTICCYPAAKAFLPENFYVGQCKDIHGAFEMGDYCYATNPLKSYGSICAGLWSGCIIGFITEYYTSNTYTPTQEVAQSCVTGAATNIIYGLALGYKSNIIPITLMAITTFIAFQMAGMYGVALAALGMLGTLATCLSIDVYGPVCDNAGGVAEMSHLPESIREKTDALDAAGNTTAAIGKGFAIGSAALVALALFGAFTTRAGEESVNILKPIVFAWIFVGAMIPYWFTAMTMKSVGIAAMEMVEEVKRQFQDPDLLAGKIEADHAKCIAISTDASLKEMVLPGLLVIISPIFCGAVFGIQAVCGLLTGSITSGVQLAISQSNTGGAWDNAKKYVEKGCVFENVDGKLVCQGKGSEVHKAAVTGDTVGDPLKDTSGPALNIVMKLQAIISLVFADFFLSINNGQGLLKISRS